MPNQESERIQRWLKSLTERTEPSSGAMDATTPTRKSKAYESLRPTEEAVASKQPEDRREIERKLSEDVGYFLAWHRLATTAEITNLGRTTTQFLFLGSRERLRNPKKIKDFTSNILQALAHFQEYIHHPFLSPEQREALIVAGRRIFCLLDKTYHVTKAQDRVFDFPAVLEALEGLKISQATVEELQETMASIRALLMLPSREENYDEAFQDMFNTASASYSRIERSSSATVRYDIKEIQDFFRNFACLIGSLPEGHEFAEVIAPFAGKVKAFLEIEDIPLSSVTRSMNPQLAEWSMIQWLKTGDPTPEEIAHFFQERIEVLSREGKEYLLSMVRTTKILFPNIHNFDRNNIKSTTVEWLRYYLLTSPDGKYRALSRLCEEKFRYFLELMVQLHIDTSPVKEALVEYIPDTQERDRVARFVFRYIPRS